MSWMPHLERNNRSYVTIAIGCTGGQHRSVFVAQSLAKIYSDLDVLVLTSLNEGTPVAVIEAMASEVPVVATRVGGVPDLVDDGVTGYLVESGDKVGLVEAITKVLNNPEEAHMMGEAGRRKVYPDYDISNLVQHLEGLYKELLREKGLI